MKTRRRTATQRTWNNKPFAVAKKAAPTESWWLGLGREDFKDAQQREDERMRHSTIGAWVWHNEVKR